MLVSLIVAMDRNRAIGLQNRVPWHLSADLQNFKRLTMGHHLVQGRRTYESIGRPLPGRWMVVLSRQRDYSAPGCDVVHSLPEALDLARSRGENEVFIGGGAGVYQESLPLADQIYLTRVQAEVHADTYFPPFDGRRWRVVERVEHEADQRNEFPFVFERLTRK